MTAPLKRHDYHLGPLGRLTAIRDPAPGYQPTPDIAATVHKLLSGKVHTDRPAFTPRAYSLSFQAMPDAELAWLEQCSLGLVPGPFYWVDPLVRNQLPPQVSVPGSVTAFETTSGTLALAAGSQGFGGVTWTPTAAAQAVRSTVRQPSLSGVSFTASAWVTRSGGASTTATVYIDWYDLAGVQLASTVGSAVTLTTSGTAYRVSVTTSSPPAGAVEGRLAVVNGAAGTFAVDGMQVEYGPLSTFQPGPGLAKVSILSYQPDVYLPGMTNVSMSMVEVGGPVGSASPPAVVAAPPAINPAAITAGAVAHAATSTTTVTPGYPAGVTVGTRLLLIRCTGDMLASLTGWTVDTAANSQDGTAAGTQVLTKVADAADASASAAAGTLSVPNTTRTSAVLVAVPGGGAVTYSKTATAGIAAASITIPAITDVTGSVLLSAVGATINTATFTPAAGQTELADYGGVSPSRAGSVSRDNTAGGTGTRTITPDVSREMAAVGIRVAPA